VRNGFSFGLGGTARTGRLGCGLAAAVLAVALVPSAGPAAPAAQAGMGPARIVAGSALMGVHGLTKVKSTNWGGYADLSTDGSTYTMVSGDWTLPKLKCTSGENGFASFWVGLDGFSDETVEQDGTRAECVDGQEEYFDWWEMYPAGVMIVNQLAQGDQITGSVAVTGTTYTLAITDHTDPSGSFSVTETCTTCTDSSAEWITEAHIADGIPFPDYGREAFTDASVTSGSTTGTISSFSYDAIITVDSSGKTVASVSKLTHHGASFTSVWHRSS
jgi:hypothetical protein